MTNPAEPTVTLAPLPPGMKHRFHAMVKPIGSLCNLDCTYCYYLHKEELLHQQRAPRMSEDMLERHIRQYIEAQTGDEVVFSWQGGEPTILGLEFFRKVVALQARYKKPGQRIENDLQTNGTLLDAEWAAFLKKHNFLVGLSCDGPERLHDRYTKGGAPTHAKVVAAARLLKQQGVPFAALCVVNRENARHPLDVYRFLTRELGARRVQFISCVEPKVFHQVAPQHWDPALVPVVGTPQAKPGAPDSVVTDWSVDPDDWGVFLNKVWDDWYARDYGKVHVDLFETAVAQSMDLPSQRYRYRLGVEREVKMGTMVTVPYAQAEFYYDTRYDSWNRRLYQAGAEIELSRRWRIEPYIARQNDESSTSGNVDRVGLVLKYYH